MIEDSGERRTFDSGAVRDIQGGKGRCDLMPLAVLGWHFSSEFLEWMGMYVETGSLGHLGYALDNLIQGESKNHYWFLLELAKHYEKGVEKYGERNWEKGIPQHSYIDSAVRHYLKHNMNRSLDIEPEEDHFIACAWNIVGAMWTHINRPDLLDLPFKEKEE